MGEEKRIPTGGRTVIKPDGTSEYVRFYDAPLSKDEQAAVAWFTELSPHEQLREVRRMKWNLEVAQKDRDTLKEASRRHDVEMNRLARQLASRRPDGFELPRSAASLLEHARAHGWRTAVAWSPDEENLAAGLQVLIARPGGWGFKLRWGVPVDGNGAGSLVRTGLARRPGRDWYDAPPLKSIRQIIASEPFTEG